MLEKIESLTRTQETGGEGYYKKRVEPESNQQLLYYDVKGVIIILYTR